MRLRKKLIWLTKNFFSSICRSAIIIMFFSIFLFYLSTFLPVSASLLSPLPVVSLEIQDRNGVLLREILSDEGGRSRWLRLKDISPYLIKATIAAEDKNFFSHPGIDPASILRALIQNISQRRVVSGASTITQQLARNLIPGRRHIFSKLRETWLALRLEHYLSKEEILTQYLNRIFYGHQAYGAEAASRLYFGKPCSELTLSEAAFLASLPRSPSLFDPYRHSNNFKERKKRQAFILLRMAELGFCRLEEAIQAKDEDLKIIPPEIAFRAPHFCEWLLSQIPFETRRRLSLLQTTLDFSWQTKIEALLKQHLNALTKRGITNGAVVVLDNQTNEILAMVGSKDFFDEKDGQVNGALARRQPGSALKPFTYALALEKGLTASTIIEDIPSSFPTESGAYVPLNFDRQYHGPVSLRTALACSYNVPAVSLAKWLSPELLVRRFRELGFDSLKQPADYYGVGLTLGNGEVTLLELVRAYSTLARFGLYLPEKIILRAREKLEKTPKKSDFKDRDSEFFDRNPNKFSPSSEEMSLLGASNGSVRQVFSPQVAYIITDILVDSRAREPGFGHITPLSFPFPVAVKTGTSEDFRDNWTIGYTPRYTVGVWVGNFDGRPMANVSGITGSGPLFHDIILLLHPKNTWADFEKPDGLAKVAVCPESGERPSPFCPGLIEEIFIQGTEPQTFCHLHTSHHKNNRLAAPEISTTPKSSESSWLWPTDNLISPNSLAHQKASPDLFEQDLSTKSLLSEPSMVLPGKQPTFSRQKTDLVITFPQDGDVFKIDPVLPPEHQQLKLRASVSPVFSVNGILEWFVNGQKIGEARPSSGFFWRLKPGVYSIKACLRSNSIIREARPITIRVLSPSPSKN